MNRLKVGSLKMAHLPDWRFYQQCASTWLRDQCQLHFIDEALAYMAYQVFANYYHRLSYKQTKENEIIVSCVAV